MKSSNILNILIILILVILMCLVYLNNSSENFENIEHPFFEKIRKYAGKKKNILICSAGPSLNQLYYLKDTIPQSFWENTYVIAVKSTVNKLVDLNINIDFIVTNLNGNIAKIDFEKLDKSLNNGSILICGMGGGGNKILKSKCEYKLEVDWQFNIMDCVIKNKKNCLDFFVKNNKLYHKWGHTMMELAIPIAVYLKPKNIFTIGWDINILNDDKINQKIHYNTENFINWASDYDIINFTKYLPSYLKKNYNINIYKLYNQSAVKLPYFSFK